MVKKKLAIESFLIYTAQNKHPFIDKSATHKKNI